MTLSELEITNLSSKIKIHVIIAPPSHIFVYLIGLALSHVYNYVYSHRNLFGFCGLLDARASSIAACCAYVMVLLAASVWCVAADISASASSRFFRHTIKATMQITNATEPSTIPAIAPGLFPTLLWPILLS